MSCSDAGAAMELQRSLIGKTELSVVVPPSTGDESPSHFALSLDLIRIQLILPRFAQGAWAAQINRAAQRASGTLLVILLARPSVVEPEEIEQASACVGRLRDPAIGLLQGGPILVLRTRLWLAMGGLEEAFDTERWALADLRRKVTALGFRAEVDPVGRRPRVAEAPASGLPDRELYRHRWRKTPRRRGASGPPKPGPTGQVVLCTAITGRYDTVKRQSATATGDARQVAFVDVETRGANAPAGWELASLNATGRGPNRDAKYYKVLPHRVFPDAPYSLWIDASVLLVAPFGVQRLVELFLRDTDLCVFEHPRGCCAYDEARYCSQRGLDDPSTIAAQMSRYERDGLPRGAGLVEASVILRRHTREVRDFNELWWREIERGSSRDQLSFPYVAWNLGVSYNRFPLFLNTHNGLFLKVARIGDREGRR